MDRRHAALLVAGLAVTMIAGDSGLDRADGASAPATRATGAESVSMPAASAGQVITLDPATGKVRPGVAQATDLQSILGDAISTSDEGLVVEKSPVPGGGMMINLQGRFQNAVTATVDDKGNLSAPCVTGAKDDGHVGDGEGE